MKKYNRLPQLTLVVLLAAFTLGATSLSDPTRPPFEVLSINQAKISEIKQLSAVYLSRFKSVAIINGQIYRVGDRIGEFTINAIKPYTVELIGPNHAMEILKLISPIKRRSIYKDQCFNG